MTRHLFQWSRIQEHLLHALHAHASNWPTIVQSHALSLLRSGEVATFPALVQHVLDDIKREAQASRNTSGSLSTSVNSKIASANGISNTNGSIMSQKNHKLESGASLIIPTRVIEEAIKVTQEHLEGICEMEQT